MRLLEELRQIVGKPHLLNGANAGYRYVTGFRSGGGPALAVVRPATLLEFWRVLEACCRHGVIVICQAANTGLTGGSTPWGNYDRPVVIINAMRIKGIALIDGGRQVLCLPGATLYELERKLAPLGREPHSVIGSSCIGASVFGGICNNSGGALVHRGPAYTEMSLYATLGSEGALRLVNHLGIALGNSPEEVLGRIDAGRFNADDVDHASGRRGSDDRYQDHVRAVDEPTPARFNADPRCLHEASGSAGRIALFAVRLDTFPAQLDTRTFYIGSNGTADLAALRREVLTNLQTLPIAGEYIHRDAFDMADRFGKDTVIAIERVGTRRLPALFALKDRLDRLAGGASGSTALSDRLMQWVGRCFPDHLPARIRAFRERFEHHLIIKVPSAAAEETAACLEARYPSTDGDFFACTPIEAGKAFLHRFAVAGAAVRYRALHRGEVEDIIALDVALRRNDAHWLEPLPAHLHRQMVAALHYGHFFCNVFHHDFLVRKGGDCAAIKRAILARFDVRGAEYPAEHNVGHLYRAKPALVDHYRALDPTNSFNPGIGMTSRQKDWSDGDIGSWPAAVQGGSIDTE